ncbi:unnamed protein product [Ostreobium quekettii]|uniref:WW domain-containing protein n=1 Tax=Ostreobium quekettii TaxID=121088 RepID=A0A8S1J3Z6_9CHLO|nr:unnamed protein product [Ostreobium quekettii]|eukprot:evm.model.scf_197EXC.2 EVM.evm.TU.scf_197EXC.2   scf_197EXC:21928-25267(+)
MELHHKLRRDPSWHPNACNICGQLGHQAVNCTNGTINWRQIYGDEAFTIKPPVFWSEMADKQKKKEVDVKELARRAREYARMQCQAQGIDYDEMIRGAQVFQHAPEQKPQLPVTSQQNGGSAGGAVKKEAPEGDLPEGWAVARDAQQRVYYWHKKTQKVQWDKPTKDTPVS